MATVASTTTFGDGQTVTWTPLTETNATGVPARFVGSGDRAFQAFGTWGGGTLKLQGSMDGANWGFLRDAATGIDVALTADGFATVLDCPTWVRPDVTAGTSVSLTAKLYTKTQKGK